ncbi:manganese superoxide dismutase [Mycena vitilis]|nr:manganese superoxide dismutase [Mycena vitilis]
MSFLWRCRHSITRASRPLIPRGTRGVTGQFDHLPLPLPYNIQEGLGDFLPPPALEAVAMEYQLGLLARLTDEVRDTDIEDKPVTQVIIATAPSRERTLAFNYASLALNNSFFLSQLTPHRADTEIQSASLSAQIRMDHGGLEQLQSTFSAAAMGMFTSGWVWFVMDKYGSTSILPTFGPGTLLVRSRTYSAKEMPNLYHEMSSDPLKWDPGMKYVGKYLSDWGSDGLGSIPSVLNQKKIEEFLTNPDPTPDPAAPSRGSNAPLRPRFLHTSARQSDSPWNSTPSNVYNTTAPPPIKSTTDALHMGEVLYPLFCLSVHEHAWLSAGYGVWGKEAWLREFWSVLNWRQIGESFDKIYNINQ